MQFQQANFSNLEKFLERTLSFSYWLFTVVLYWCTTNFMIFEKVDSQTFIILKVFSGQGFYNFSWNSLLFYYWRICHIKWIFCSISKLLFKFLIIMKLNMIYFAKVYNELNKINRRCYLQKCRWRPPFW